MNGILEKWKKIIGNNLYNIPAYYLNEVMNEILSIVEKKVNDIGNINKHDANFNKYISSIQNYRDNEFSRTISGYDSSVQNYSGYTSYMDSLLDLYPKSCSNILCVVGGGGGQLFGDSFDITQIESISIDGIGEVPVNKTVSGSGIVRIKCSPEINASYMFDGCDCIKEIIFKDNLKFTNMHNMFRNCSALKRVDFRNSDTSLVVDMENLFHGCSKLVDLTISNFSTSNVRYMSRIFFNCSSLQNIDLSSFTFDSCDDINGLFYGCVNLFSIKFGSIPPPIMSNSFGASKNTYVGSSSKETRYLKIPGDSTGFETGYWQDILLNSNKCGFRTNKYY